MDKKEPVIGHLDVNIGQAPSIGDEFQDFKLNYEEKSPDNVRLKEAANAPKVDSQTSPQLNNIYRRALMLQMFLERREKDYAAHIKDYPLKGKSEDERQAFFKNADEKFYGFEKNQLKKIAEPLVRQRGADELGEPMENVVLSGMAPESAMAISYFTDEFESYLKKEWPTFISNYNSAVLLRSDAMFLGKYGVPQTVRMAAAVESMFKEKFPGLQPELEKSASSLGNDADPYKKALSLLKMTSYAVNPSGMFISLAVGAIMKTEAMSPLRNLISKAVSHSTSNFLKPASKKVLGFLPEKHAGKIATGLAFVGVATLFMTGVIDTEEAQKIVSNVSDFVNEMEAPSLDTVSQTFADPISYVSEAFSNGKEAQLSDLSLDDSVTLDASEGSDQVQPDSSVIDTTPSPATDVTNTPEPALNSSSAPDLSTSSEPATAAEILKELGGGTEVAPDEAISVEDDNPLTVKPGDCLSMIAEAQLKAAGIPYNYSVITAYYQEIAALNGIPNPDVIHPGQQLVMPPLDVGASVSQDFTPEAPAAFYVPEFNPTSLSVGEQYQYELPEEWAQISPGPVELPSAEDLFTPVAGQQIANHVEPIAPVNSNPRPAF